MTQPALSPHPNPVDTFPEALERLHSLLSSDGLDVHPDRRTLLLDHGKKQPRAIAFFHGYTSSPCQFKELAAQFHALGYNALIMRLPHHGLVDRMTPEVKDLTAEELAATAHTGVDIACGLGDHITVCGLSAGGVTAAYAAQFRSEVDLAAIISPGFGFKLIPTSMTRAAMHIVKNIPNIYRWWDPVKKDADGIEHAYPRYASQSLVQILRLGFQVQTAALKRAPAARKIVVITNANDMSVNNALTAEVVKLWRSQHADVATYEFPLDLQLDHDLIDPACEMQKIDLVYPKLFELIQV